MDFSEALRHVRNGGLIKRSPLWDFLGVVVATVVPTPESNIMPFLAARAVNGMMMAWTPSHEDLFADDWIETKIEGGDSGHD